MKKAGLFLLSVLYVIAGFSQSAYETTVSYDKKKQKAFAIDYSYSTETVESAIERHIQKLGHLGKTEKGIFNRNKGFIVFSDAVISDISEERMDYLVKVEKGKGNDQSTLYLAINKAGSDVIPSMTSKDISKIRSFLSNLMPEVEEAHLEMKIKDQDDAVVKSEKKLKQLQDEKVDLEKKTQKNTTDLDNIQKQIESQRHAMDSLKAKRKL